MLSGVEKPWILMWPLSRTDLMQDVIVKWPKLESGSMRFVPAHCLKRENWVKEIWDTFGCSVNTAFVSAAEYLLSQTGRSPSAWAAGTQVWMRVAFSLCPPNIPLLSCLGKPPFQKTCSCFPHTEAILLHFPPQQRDFEETYASELKIHFEPQVHLEANQCNAFHVTW